MMAWVDGEFVAGGAVPRVASGKLGPFETMGATAGQVPLWGRHLERLAAAAASVGLTVPGGNDTLAAGGAPEWRAAAAELLLRANHGDGILRLALVPVADRTHVVMTSRLRSPARSVVLLPTVVERQAADPPGDIKTTPRRFYDAVLQQAQDGGADDGLVVDRDGAVLETAVANLFVCVDGVWATPPLDGRVLPGIARQRLFERAPAGTFVERSIDLGDLHRAEALATTNAVYGPRAASLLDGERPAVELVDRELGRYWQS
ncbi:MAG: aminotransferase class IV [bacterium]|nr:aminotransferase class IV [bacterium]